MEIEDTKFKIEERIFTIRGKQVMLDRNLAQLYGVETKVLNQAVRRNIERFPGSFMFKLNKEEFEELVTICDRLIPSQQACGQRQALWPSSPLPLCLPPSAFTIQTRAFW